MKVYGLQACLKTPHNIRNLRMMLVSHAFVDLWKMIVEDSSFDKGLYDQMDEQERDFMRYSLNKCKISSRPFDSVYNEQLDGLVKRLKVLEGAKSIGDDNPSIQKEMKTIIHQSYQKGVFSTGYYNQFKIAYEYIILLNLNNQVSTNQYKYTFSQPIDFSQYEVALGSISIYYSWRAITAQRGNNTFKVIWPTGSSTTTYTITLSDGTYTANDINNNLQYWSIQNNLVVTINPDCFRNSKIALADIYIIDQPCFRPRIKYSDICD
ncbi:TPA: hypothetical protein N0F65_010211 [Lagenidium giganteum]|uniref:Uncharacterized protein n=1 Tax=Lagenidium giganteum TaxID=4803 RepID=A0AAV2YVN3_9STRA|nr:TPA: hypothetical protein N0F65_010211 [Lagenidium giganteum]